MIDLPEKKNIINDINETTYLPAIYSMLNSQISSAKHLHYILCLSEAKGIDIIMKKMNTKKLMDCYSIKIQGRSSALT